MFKLPNSFESSKEELHNKISAMKNKYNLLHTQHRVYKDYSIDKVLISPTKPIMKKLIFTSGIHGIEGFIGHAAIMSLLDNIDNYLQHNIEVIIYHILNPYGMINKCRVNENNVDLNRNFFTEDFYLEYDELKDVNKLYSPQKHNSILILKIKLLLLHLKIVFFKRRDKKRYLDAIQGGQNKYDDRMCYAGISHQESTKYMIHEQQSILKTTSNFIWIDMHSGLQHKNNYLYFIPFSNDIVKAKELARRIDIATIDLNENNESNFDMVAPPLFTSLQYYSDQMKSPPEFLLLTLEFRTSLSGVFNNLKSSVAMILENSSRFIEQTNRVKKYISKYYPKIFIMDDHNWLSNAETDFLKSIDLLIDIEKFNKQEKV